MKMRFAISGILLACMLALLPSCGRADVAAPPSAPAPSARTAPHTPLVVSPADATGAITQTVQIVDGSCCAGGVAGSIITLRAAPSATKGVSLEFVTANIITPEEKI